MSMTIIKIIMKISEEFLFFIFLYVNLKKWSHINYNDQYFDYILFTDLWKIQKEIKRSQIPTDEIDIEK